MALTLPTPIFSMGLPSPVPICERPLKGLDFRGSELQLAPGAMLDLRNLIVTPKGLYRLPGYDDFADGAEWSPADNPCTMLSGFGANGKQYPFLFTQNYIFAISWEAYTQCPWVYDEGTVDTSGTAVTGLGGTLWLTLGIKAGDRMTIGATTYTIESVTDDDSIVLTSSAGTQSDVAYSIERLLAAGNDHYIDVCQVSDLTLGSFLIGANPNCQIFALIPETNAVANLTETAELQPASGGFTAKAVGYFVNRIFAGNLDDGSLGKARTRIRWSRATNVTDFSDVTAYIDLVAQCAAFSGEIQKIVPLGTMLVVYLDDAIFIGTPSNIANLPVAFQQIPSGSVGLVGSRAVASLVMPSGDASAWGINTTGHFFVSGDNIYFLSSANLSIEPIGSKVVRETLRKCLYPTRVQIAIDWNRKCVRFGFPRSSPNIEYIYEYQWETKEWSYEQRSTWMIADLPISSAWDPIPMTTVASVAMTTIDLQPMTLSWGTATSFYKSHFVEHEGALWASSTSENALDPDSSVIGIALETPDYDEGAPSFVKFWRMLRVKISWDTEEPPSIPITFSVSISVDRGRSWRNIGVVAIASGNDECHVNFRATGPHIRFRIESTSGVTPYYISEITRYASIRGIQASQRQQNAAH